MANTIDQYSLLKKCRVFLTVVEQGSFTAAAQALGVAQPWVSVQVQQLEHNLGYRLLDRTSRAIELTPEGISVLPLMSEALADFASFAAAAKDISNNGYHLKIGIEYSATHDPQKNRLIAEFSKRYPRVDIVALRYNIHEIPNKLMLREIDIAYSFYPDNDERIQTLHMASHEIVLLIPSSHPFASFEVIPVEMLNGQRVMRGGVEASTEVYRRFSEKFDGLDIHWVVPPDPGHDCRIQMTQNLGIPSIWLGCLHDGSLPDDIVVRPLEGPALLHEFGLQRLKDRRNKAADLIWDLATQLKTQTDQVQDIREPHVHALAR